MFAPVLIWWGDDIRPEQKIEDVVDLMAGHYGFKEELKFEPATDMKIAGLPAKRVEITFKSSVPFAPPGKNPASMKAVLYLVRENGQENGLWYESPVQEFDAYLTDVATMVSTAETFKRVGTEKREEKR